MAASGRPVRVAIVNDYELVVVGVAALLEPFSDRVPVVELDSGLPVLQRRRRDPLRHLRAGAGRRGRPGGAGHGSDAKVAIFSWNLQRDLVERAIAQGAVGLPVQGAGRPRRSWTRSRGARRPDRPSRWSAPADEPVAGDWPGREFGLTAREAEIIALITQGLSNQEIAERSYLSINSVKTYIRTAYRKMGVGSRSQAVLWGVNHGFRPDVVRRDLGRAGLSAQLPSRQPPSGRSRAAWGPQEPLS